MHHHISWVRLFLKRFGKYFLILSILVGMTLPLISTASSFATRRILERSKNRVEEGLQLLQNQIDKSQDMVRALLEEKALVDLLLLEDVPQTKHYMQFKEIQRKLQNFAPSQDYLDYSYIVFEKNPIFISSHLSSDNEENVYPAFFSYEGVSFEDWYHSLFTGPFDIRFLTNKDYRIGGGKRQTSFTYLINMTYYTAIDNSAVLGCVFSGKKMTEALLPEELQKDSFLLLTNQMGEQMFSYQLPSDPIFSDASVPEWVTVERLRYRTVTATNDSLGVTALVGIPEEILKHDFDGLMKVAFLYFVGGLLLILLCSLIFSVREAKLMRNLVIVAGQTTGSLYQPSNEFAYLQTAIQRMGEEDRVKLLRIQQLNYQVVVRMLHVLLLQGIYTEKEAEEIRGYFGNRLDCCIVVKLLLLEDTQKARLQMENLLHSTLPTAFEWVMLPKNEIAILLFLQPSGVSEYTDFLFFETLAEQVPLQVGISEVCTSIFHVRDAYLQAQTALQQLSSDGVVGVFHHTPVLTTTPDTALFKKLYDCILYGEEKGVLDIFEHIFSRYTPQILDQTDQQQIYFSLRQPIAAALEESADLSSEEETQQLAALINPTGKTALEQVEALKSAALLLCKWVNRKKKSGNTQLKEGILQYLQENFADTTLCAAKIASHFSISEKYVYLFVKEQTGQPLGTIIETIRITEAKQLLSTTDYPNRKIAELTGFGSENTFYRVFSKYHGVSPSVWRKKK